MLYCFIYLFVLSLIIVIIILIFIKKIIAIIHIEIIRHREWGKEFISFNFFQLLFEPVSFNLTEFLYVFSLLFIMNDILFVWFCFQFTVYMLEIEISNPIKCEHAH